MKLFILFLYLFSKFSFGNESVADKRILNQKCSKEIQGLLKDWGDVGRQWVGHLYQDGEINYFKPTNLMSIWIGQEMIDGKLVLSRHTPTSIVHINFDHECQRNLKVVKNVKPIAVDKQIINDAKLFAFIAKNTNGLIYHYSTGMNLSLAGIKTIQEISKKMKLPVLFLLDETASSDLKAVEKRLKQDKIELDEIKVSHSMEMYFRKTYIHYPNLTLFKNGQMLDVFFPGLGSKIEYENFIKDRMN